MTPKVREVALLCLRGLMVSQTINDGPLRDNIGKAFVRRQVFELSRVIDFFVVAEIEISNQALEADADVRRIHDIPPADLRAIIEMVTCVYEEHDDEFDDESEIDEGKHFSILYVAT